MLKRVTFFVYGVISYLVFLGTYLYAVGFIGNFGVPTTLDGPASGSLMTAIAIDLGLLKVFALQHSIMARPWFKRWWTRFVPQPIERSTYVLLSSLALIAMFWLWRPLGVTIWQVDALAGQVAFYALYALGSVILLTSTFLINHFDLFGLRQVWLELRGLPYTTLQFRTPFLYRIVRHPLYVGWFLIFWMTPTMTLAHLLFALATTAYILIAIQFEERDLVREHGESYEQYRRTTPMLVPFAKGANAD